MSFFGDTLTSLYQKADAATKAAFNTAAKTTQQAAAALEQGYNYAKDKAQATYDYTKHKAGEAVDYTKQKAAEAVDYTKHKAAEAVDYTKHKVQEGYHLAKDTAKQVRDYAANKIEDAKKSVRQQIAAAKQAVSKILNPQPAGAAILPCAAQTKAERVKLRSQKIDEAKNKLKSMPPSPDQKALAHATERLARTNYAVERARLAADTYNVSQGEPPEGWERVGKSELKKLGIDTNAFPQFKADFDPQEYKDGFYPELYKSKADVFGEEKYVLALRGTQGRVDWVEGNIKQGVGMTSEHYEQAKNIARNLQQALAKSGKTFEVTGHSLGGGLATAASIVTGAPGFAIDPAGVHPNTLESAGAYSREQANQLVQNYYAKGEILTTVQDPTVQRMIASAGVAVGDVPAALGMSALFGRALTENGTLTYGAAGPMYQVPALANAHEVAQAIAKGDGIQGMTPGLFGGLNNKLNPWQKIELHDPDYVIAGMEQQKADDLAVIERNLSR